ncbi:MAG: hypothetical protein ABEJ69_03015 [Candidatus Nanohaloarchaea archaeon]
MTLLEAAFGALGAGIFAAIAYLNWRLLQHFRDHEKVSMAMFFLKSEALHSFQLLLVTGLVFSIGMITAATALIIQNPVLDNASKAGSVIVWLGFLYFFHVLEKVTRRKVAEEN